MKQFFILFHFLFVFITLSCQVNNEQQLERIAESEDVEIGDDSYLQQLDYYRKDPIDLNRVDASILRDLDLLTEIQVQNFLNYRKLLGPLVNIHELQAIPGWDPGLIRKIMPYVMVNSALTLEEDLRSGFKGGNQFILLKVSQSFNRSEDANNATYRGGPQHIILRYQYNYRNLLQYGILGEKDAGEDFFRGAQKMGFDFYSFHLFIRRAGFFNAIALGDFTANLGQGLIHWQSLAFKKSADVLSIKRHSPVLKPYRSAGEYYFSRGVGLSMKKKRMEASLFLALRKLDANKHIDTSGIETISSFLSSGYHRKESEILSRSILKQFSNGLSLSWNNKRSHFGINGIYHRFSIPVQKRDEPYNLYSIKGKNWYNLSLDYGHTWKNIHFFGESAFSKQGGLAFLHGILISMDQKFDLCFLQRNIGSRYQSLYGNAFVESNTVSNEKGLYAGFSFRPASNWVLNGYADQFIFPWLKYSVDAISRGRDYLLQLSYSPSKNIEFTARYRDEIKPANEVEERLPIHNLVPVRRKGWRLQHNIKVNPSLTVRNRVEILFFNKDGSIPENGWLGFLDLLIKPALKSWNAAFRIQFFETEGYNSRLYAFENDVLFTHSIPAFYGQGLRFYISGNYDLPWKLGCWVKISRTIYPGEKSGAAGLGEIKGEQKTDLSILFRFTF